MANKPKAPVVIDVFRDCAIIVQTVCPPPAAGASKLCLTSNLHHNIDLSFNPALCSACLEESVS